MSSRSNGLVPDDLERGRFATSEARGSGPVGRGPRGNRSATSAARTALALLVPALVIGGVYLAPYVEDHARMPVGFDTAKYVWRTKVVAALGLDGLMASRAGPVRAAREGIRGSAAEGTVSTLDDPAIDTIPGGEIHGFKVHPDRPGYPLVVALLGSILDRTPLIVAFILPAVIATAIGLAAGAFAVGGLREPSWSFAAYAVGVGTSGFVARTAVGYGDNLLFDVLAVAAAFVAVKTALGGSPRLALALLLTGAVLFHWAFTVAFAGVLLALALALVPTSLSERQEGSPLRDVPSARLLSALACSAVVGAGALATGGRLPSEVPAVGARAISRKLELFLPTYRLGPIAAIAALGAVALLSPTGRIRRWSLVLAALWAGIAVAGLVVFHGLSLSVPVHRLIGFALAIPLLAVAALVAVARLASSRVGVFGRVSGVVVVVVGLTIGAMWTGGWWATQRSWTTPEQLVQTEVAGRYLERIRPEDSFLFVVGGGSMRVPARIIRAGLPGELVPQARFITSADLEALGGPAGALEADRILVYLRAVSHQSPGPRATEIADGVAVVGGPQLEVERTVPPRSPTGLELALLTLGSVTLLATAGLGWAAGLVRTGWLERVGLAPAFGLATIALLALVADQLGMHLAAPVAWAVLVVSASCGWVVFLAHTRIAPSSTPAAPSTTAVDGA